MPIISKIAEQKRRPNRRTVYIDGVFAFGCNLNVVARFRLREGLNISAEQVLAIQRDEVRQECFDAAMRFLQGRLHSRSELHKKLMRNEYGESIINDVLDQLTKLNYVNDEQFACAKATSARNRHHGRARAKQELMRAGVRGAMLDRALAEVYSPADDLAGARALAVKQAPRLKKLEPQTARRRLIGMLQRRGFGGDAIMSVVQDALGRGDEDD